jgi:Arc/MetJ-type ribon-helix-helix transcriptional regulator
MTVELSDEMERLLREQLNSGHFRSVDDVLRSALAELATRNNKLNRQRIALQQTSGAWKDEDHPELAGGSAAWIRQLRADSLERAEQIEQHRQAK